MKCLFSHSTDPYFNLATEEYLLKKFSEDIYFQYVNVPSVVIGKHQNALAEVDLDFLEQEEILLARRISGGGAVYHDPGNVNYCFLTNEKEGDFVKFEKYTAPIIAYLKYLGLDAKLGKRNEILVGEFKVSGTASHVFKKRAMHHGTLLFAADLSKLSQSLYVNQEAFSDKGVRSVRSEVRNIGTMLKGEIETATFYRELFEFILDRDEGTVAMELSAGDLQAIEVLRREKFTTWDWNFGYSPKFTLERELRVADAKLLFRTTVKKGIIEELVVQGERILFDLDLFTEKIKGKRHHPEEIMRELEAMSENQALNRSIVKALF